MPQKPVKVGSSESYGSSGSGGAVKERFIDVVDNAKSKPATYQKKIN